VAKTSKSRFLVLLSCLLPSNFFTTFFRYAVPILPPGMDGQSYHPYMGIKKFPEQEARPKDNLEGFTPDLKLILPEGWSCTFVQTESLMRLINPEARKKKPEGVEKFEHYMSEHGFYPRGMGIKDRNKALIVKAKCLIRSLLFWLNKGIKAQYIHCAWQKDDLDMGILLSRSVELNSYPEGEKLNEYLSPALKALKNVVKKFEGSKQLSKTRNLDFEVFATGKQKKIFEGDRTHPPLYHRDVFVILPYQINEKKFVIPLYVMTYDITKEIEREYYILKVKNVKGERAKISYYDPLKDEKVPFEIKKVSQADITLYLPVVDYPYLLTIKEE